MKIGIKQANSKGFEEIQINGVADFSFPTSNTRRGRVIRGGQTAPTITVYERDICKVETNDNEIIETKYRIRRLTELECWRLMGFTDEDFKKAQSVNSKTQLYKQAGNSIVVPVLMAIFSQLNIDGVKPWNEMSNEERECLINGRFLR